MLAALQSIRDAISASAEKTESLVQRVERLEAVVAGSAAQAPGDDLPADSDALTALERGVAHLSNVVAGTGETVHAHHAQIVDIRIRLERLQGTLLDQLALDRRLAGLEDKIATVGALNPDSPGG
ncbi:MAG: hypothetical protein FWC87_03195 [Acidimicrobiaceae bacterium]|nr:hypothetical protein [Acidimicrobiaceae bacterium]